MATTTTTYTTTTPAPLSAIEGWAENRCGIKLRPTEISEVHVGSFPRLLKWGPLEAAPVITDNKTSTELVADTDFVWSELGQLVPLKSFLPTVWKIDYTAGYAEIPADLQEVLDALEAWIAGLEAHPAMQSERLGDYSYSVQQAFDALSNPHVAILDSYRRFL